MPDNKQYRVIICDQCGRQSEPDMRFCTYCGAALTKSSVKISSTTTTKNSDSEAGNLLFQRLKSKDDAESEIKPSDTVKTVSKKASKSVNESKTESPMKDKIQTATTQVGHVVNQKLKLKLLEHLKNLNKLDRTLEASAIIHYRDHSVLAAATSTRSSKTLMATIAGTVFDICSDSIKALGGGQIRVLNITAENITVMLSPVNQDIVLIVVTNPKSNVGLISMYLELTAQKVRALLEESKN